MPFFVFLKNKNRRGRPQALICCGTFSAAGYVSRMTLSETEQNVKEFVPNLARKTRWIPLELELPIRGMTSEGEAGAMTFARGAIQLPAKTKFTLQIHRYKLRDAAFSHGHTVESVHPRHGQAMVGDDKEPCFRHLRHFLEQGAHAIHVGIIKRRINLVKDADRRGVGEEHCKDQCR